MRVPCARCSGKIMVFKRASPEVNRYACEFRLSCLPCEIEVIAFLEHRALYVLREPARAISEFRDDTLRRFSEAVLRFVLTDRQREKLAVLADQHGDRGEETAAWVLRVVARSALSPEGYHVRRNNGPGDPWGTAGA